MTRRAKPWWQGVEAEAEDPGEVRDPWADQPLLAAALTTAQRAVLAGLDDQPAGPRLDGLLAELPESAAGSDDRGSDGGGGSDRPDGSDGDGGDGSSAPADQPTGPDRLDQPSVPRLRVLRPGNGTGNPPGDPEPGRSYRRRRWTEQEEG